MLAAVSGEPVPTISPDPKVSDCETVFVPSFKPFKPEKKLTRRRAAKVRVGDFTFDAAEFGMEESVDNYPHRYRNEVFRSLAEVRWAKAFDRLGLRWKYEPLKFDMGPTHVSYCPDFRVAGLSIPDSDRALLR